MCVWVCLSVSFFGIPNWRKLMKKEFTWKMRSIKWFIAIEWQNISSARNHQMFLVPIFYNIIVDCLCLNDLCPISASHVMIQKTFTECQTTHSITYFLSKSHKIGHWTKVIRSEETTFNRMHHDSLREKKQLISISRKLGFIFLSNISS